MLRRTSPAKDTGSAFVRITRAADARLRNQYGTYTIIGCTVSMPAARPSVTMPTTSNGFASLLPRRKRLPSASCPGQARAAVASEITAGVVGRLGGQHRRPRGGRDGRKRL